MQGIISLPDAMSYDKHNKQQSYSELSFVYFHNKTHFSGGEKTTKHVFCELHFEIKKIIFLIASSYLEASMMINRTFYYYSKTCVKRPLKNRQNKDLKDKY